MPAFLWCGRHTLPLHLFLEHQTRELLYRHEQPAGEGSTLFFQISYHMALRRLQVRFRQLEQWAHVSFLPPRNLRHGYKRFLLVLGLLP